MVDPNRGDEMNQTEPSNREEEEGGERHKCAVEDVDTAKGHRSQRPAIAGPFGPEGETGRLRQQENPDDKVRQLMGEGPRQGE